MVSMEPGRHHARRDLPVLAPLPQLVPSHVCFKCDVCCRFPESDSFLRPYFTGEEIVRAVEAGIAAKHFPDPAGSQVRLVPNPNGEGFLCPAFDSATSHCRVYEARPLDCQIYPFALMWSADHREVLLGWDSKCPFMREAPPDLTDYADQIAALIEQPETVASLENNRRLVGPFQDDVIVIRPLLLLTERLTAKDRSVPPPAPRPLRPLTLADRHRFEAALASWETPLAHYAFAPHFIWRSLLDYGWTELAGHLCLFADSPDGLFMPLLPLGRSEQGPVLAHAVAEAFSYMRRINGGSAVSRIENVPEELTAVMESGGYRLTPKGPDYLYRTADLAHLAGDRYRSQRTACNRFLRESIGRYEAYRDGDRDACLRLYRTWVAQQEARKPGDMARAMLEDAEAAHREVLTHHAALGLVGRVVRAGDDVVAYTFGYPRSPAVFCVLLEVADRGLAGLAQFIFREFCREAEGQGYACVNTMDDSHLPALARAKLAYRPVRLVPSYVATEGDGV
jgi:Fe-S-cluster containining protein